MNSRISGIGGYMERIFGDLRLPRGGIRRSVSGVGGVAGYYPEAYRGYGESNREQGDYGVTVFVQDLNRPAEHDKPLVGNRGQRAFEGAVFLAWLASCGLAGLLTYRIAKRKNRIREIKGKKDPKYQDRN